LAFVVLAAGIGMRMMDLVLATYSSVTALVLTPIVWRRFVNQADRGTRGRGAAAGALILGLAQLLPSTVLMVSSRIARRHGDGMSASLDVLGFVFVLAVACGAAVVGGAAGAVLGIRRAKTEAAR